MHYNLDGYNVIDQASENPITVKFYSTLTAPLQQRCGELTVLFDRANSKDLQNLFPVLIENIFGINGSIGWGLRTITSESNNRDFGILHHFLGPFGPVFRLIYKLMGDHYVRYEYPVSQLPMKIRNNLENGQISPFYSDLICYDLQTKQIVCLQLNPFDYYMFQFAWHLISPWQQRITIMNHWGLWNTVYYVLSCDYLIHFLPTDPYNPVPLPHVSPQFTGKNPLVTHLQVQNKNVRASKLFRPQILQQASMEMNMSQTYQQHPRGEIWRSETIIQIFNDIWLTNDQFNNQIDIPYLKHTQVYELPSAEYIRIIRVGVKQLHAFVDSGKNDITPIGEWKKLVMPMVQRKMYIFLRHLIHRWPLDGSFRLLLELWLSFIQPWRYTANYLDKDSKRRSDDEEMNSPSNEIDRQYLCFIADNLLAYTIIFQQLLPRFLRIDLTSPKNAVLMYRVTKVFAQPNLVTMLKEVENCVDNRNHSPSHSYSGMWSSLPPLSPTSNWSTNTPIVQNSAIKDIYNTPKTTGANDSPRVEATYYNTTPKNGKWTNIVRQHIFDLEGPEFFYKPMFTDAPAPEVVQLLNNLKQAIISVKQFLVAKEEVIKHKQKGFIGFFKSLFLISTENGDEFSIEERKKVPEYLELAQEYLVNIFSLHLYSTTHQNVSSASFTDLNSLLNNNSSCNIDSSTNLNKELNSFLTPENIRKRAATIRYTGDPELMPVSSTECGILVNICNSISKKINEAYGEVIAMMYHRSDLYGAIARQLIQPPRLIYSYDKSLHGCVSPRVQKLLPPRISLRYFASHKFIYCFIISIIIGRIFGHDLFFTVSIGILLSAIFIFIKGVIQYHISSRATTHQNINADLSF